MPASDYILPVGKLQAAFLPGQDLAAFVEVWLAQATASAASLSGATQARAIEAYVYWRGYETAAEAMIAEAASADIEGEGSRSFNQAQYAYFTGEAARWQAVYETAIPPTGTTPAVASIPTASVSNVVRWV